MMFIYINRLNYFCLYYFLIESLLTWVKTFLHVVMGSSEMNYVYIYHVWMKYLMKWLSQIIIILDLNYYRTWNSMWNIVYMIFF
jgi:hypothetical protein